MKFCAALSIRGQEKLEKQGKRILQFLRNNAEIPSSSGGVE
jgi:hypothetical protein